MKRSDVAMALAAAGAACGAEKVVPPGPATYASAFAVARVGGRAKLYLPQPAPAAGNAFLAVVNLDAAGNGTAGAPARLGKVDLPSPTPALLVAGDERGLIAIAAGSPSVWFIDPVADRVTATLTLDGRFGTFRYPGAPAPQFVSGALVDNGRGLAYLAVWNGFAEVDMASHAVRRVLVAAPTESPGYDPDSGLLLAPFYDCDSVVNCRDGSGQPLCTAGTGTPPPCGATLAQDGSVVTDGLNVITLADGAVYSYRDQTTAGPAFATGSSPDAAAVDPVLHVAVVPLENDLDEVFLDLSRLSFDFTSHSFTAPRTDHPGLFLEAVAVDPLTHLVFMAGAFDRNIAVVCACQGLAGASIVQAHLPDLPGGTPWQSAGDPHPAGIAILGGRPTGIVVELSMRWVALVDLAALPGLPRAGAEWTPAETAPAVTYLDSSLP